MEKTDFTCHSIVLFGTKINALRMLTMLVILSIVASIDGLSKVLNNNMEVYSVEGVLIDVIKGGQRTQPAIKLSLEKENKKIIINYKLLGWAAEDLLVGLVGNKVKIDFVIVKKLIGKEFVPYSIYASNNKALAITQKSPIQELTELNIFDCIGILCLLVSLSLFNFYLAACVFLNKEVK